LTTHGTHDTLIWMPPPRRRTTAGWIPRERAAAAAASAALLAVVGQGCAALPLAAVAAPLLQLGGGAIVKTGTEYTASGTVLRTFTIPVDDVHTAVIEAFCRADLPLSGDESSNDGGHAMLSETEHRKVRVRLTPLTRSLTEMELGVKRNFLASDKATASELVEQTEQALAEKPALAPRLDRGSDGLPRP
jgi:hypothetical protein